MSNISEMKTLQLSLAVLAGTISILCASYHIGFSTDEPTSILDSSMPPIIVTQVELWGPSSFHTDNIIQCEDNETSLGPWAVGWIEIHNTKNDSITISDVDLKGKGWEEGQFPMTLGPQEYCYIVTQNQVSTRIGVGGSLGNGQPPHDNVTTILSYSVQSFDKKMNYTYSTPPLSDDLGDAKTWQLVDGIWVFLDTNFKQELFTKTIMSPLEQFKSGVALKDIKCAPDLQLVIKATSRSPACVKLDDVSKLVERGWADKPNSLQEQLDFTNVCTGMNDACRNRFDVKNNDPFGITALIIYHPPDLCLNPQSHSIPYGMPSCPPNKFYLKINSNSTAYLKGYNTCDGNSCATNNTLSLILPLNTGLNPDYQMIGLPVNLPWKYGDTVGIKLYVSPTSDNKTAFLVDLGSSEMVP